VRTLKLTLRYDGTDFHGWQVQPGRRTVQGVLAEACARILRHEVVPTGAGRTDAGVHALGQVASLETPCAHACEKIRGGLNAVLPDDVAVSAVEDVEAGFSARFSARWKHYRYRILGTRDRDPLERRTAWHVPFPLDVERMHEAARGLVGEHDFRCFARHVDRNLAPGEAARSTVRTLFSVDAARAGHIISLDVRGDGFLYNMVRAIAGTLVEVGRGARPVEFAGEALAARERAAAGPTAPPQGLFLMEVGYAAAGAG
jgi:tRNA pseudouridine38-40 synthase